MTANLLVAAISVLVVTKARQSISLPSVLDGLSNGLSEKACKIAEKMDSVDEQKPAISSMPSQSILLPCDDILVRKLPLSDDTDLNSDVHLNKATKSSPKYDCHSLKSNKKRNCKLHLYSGISIISDRSMLELCSHSIGYIIGY